MSSGCRLHTQLLEETEKRVRAPLPLHVGLNSVGCERNDVFGKHRWAKYALGRTIGNRQRGWRGQPSTFPGRRDKGMQARAWSQMCLIFHFVDAACLMCEPPGLFASNQDYCRDQPCVRLDWKSWSFYGWSYHSNSRNSRPATALAGNSREPPDE